MELALLAKVENRIISANIFNFIFMAGLKKGFIVYKKAPNFRLRLSYFYLEETGGFEPPALQFCKLLPWATRARLHIGFKTMRVSVKS